MIHLTFRTALQTGNVRSMLRYILFCLIPFGVFADGVTSGSIASVETGLICPPTDMATSPAPDTLAGTTHVITEDPAFAARTRIVPAILGIGFGVKSQAVDVNGLAPVLMVIEHPPMGPTQATEQSFFTTINGTRPSLTFYQFDHTYELVTGTWRMTALFEGEVLFTTQFEVVHPRKLPELASLCSRQNLLS